MNLMLEFSCGEGVISSVISAIEKTRDMIQDFGASVIAAGYRNGECRLVQEFLGDGVVAIALQVCRRSCFEVRLEIGDMTLHDGKVDASVSMTSQVLERPPMRGVAVEGAFRLVDLECETIALEGVSVETGERAA